MKTIKRCPSRKGVRVKHEVLLGFVPIPQGPHPLAELPHEKTPTLPVAVEAFLTPGHEKTALPSAVEAFLAPGQPAARKMAMPAPAFGTDAEMASNFFKAPGVDRRPEMVSRGISLDPELHSPVPELPLWRPNRDSPPEVPSPPTLLSPASPGPFGAANPPLPIGRMPNGQRAVYDPPEERRAQGKGGKKGGAPQVAPRAAGRMEAPAEARMPAVPTGAQMAAELVNVLRQTSAAPEQDQLADMFIQDLEKMVQQYRGNQAKATQQVPPTAASTVPMPPHLGAPASATSFFKPTRTENLLSAVPMPPHMGPMVPERSTAGQVPTAEDWWQAAAAQGRWPDSFQPSHRTFK